MSGGEGFRDSSVVSLNLAQLKLKEAIVKSKDESGHPFGGAVEDHEIDTDLSALLDGELAEDEAARLRLRMTHSPKLAERFAELGAIDGQIRRLGDQAPSPARLEALRERLQMRIDADAAPAAGASDPDWTETSGADEARVLPLRRRWMGPVATALAAGLAFYLFYTPGELKDSPTPVLQAAQPVVPDEAVVVETAPAEFEAIVQGIASPQDVVAPLAPEAFVSPEAAMTEVALEEAATTPMEVEIDLEAPQVESQLAEVSGTSPDAPSLLQNANEVELAVVLEYDVLMDLDVIENLELLQRLSILDGPETL